MTQASTHLEKRGISETSITWSTDGRVGGKYVEVKTLVRGLRGIQAHVVKDTGRSNG